MSTAFRPRPAGEQGSAAVELAVLAPVLLLVLLLVIAGGRVSTARAQVREAARDAARAASLQRTPADADTAARMTAQTALADAGLHCQTTGTSTQATFDGAGSGGSVHVTVSCQVALADLSPVPLPGSTTVTSDATSVLDTYRSQQ